MSLVKCTECGKEKSSSAKFCPYCGHRPTGSNTWIGVTLTAVALFFIFGFYQANKPEELEKQKHRDAIEQCHKVMERNPGNFVASGACQILEDQFQKQFGHRP